MSNVLPPEEKNLILRRFRERFIALGALVLLLGAGVASLSLLPSLILVSSAEASLRRATEAASKTVREDQVIQTRTLALIQALQGAIQATSSPTQVLQRALELKPKGLKITSISAEKGKMLLSGISDRRESINAYREALEKSSIFTSVAIPVAALVGAQEGRFTVTLTGNF